ncbi:helix-turn-helix transcriptional regulator [Microlunatus ginsengisoli]|uniref:HTH luxR-type domain-containing protein n=1 Tax=Microlunatus ginsengisoli TaxID=363863 RepID=A0ABP7AV91_9ACTN
MDFDEVVAIGSRLSQLPDRTAYRRAAREQLLRLVPADDALWIQAADQFGSGCVAIRGDRFAIDRQLSGDLTRYWTRHVTPRWQTAHVHERTPFRVSDIIAPRRWREQETYHELKYAMPEHQLNIAPPPPARFRCWMLARRASDFTDAEVELAIGLAPVLATLGLMYDRLEPWQEVAQSGNNQADLTARELGVLGALADGLPARAIGRRLGISMRTVDKHLEHIYRKLGCRDRLIAVAIARQLGLLPVIPPPAGTQFPV